jgi:MATE family multidrug resistance protein
MSASLNHPREEFWKLGKLALPIAIAQAGQSLMSFVDSALVGRLGTAELAAVGLSNAVFAAFSSFGVGLMMGMDPLISQSFGARRTARAWALLWQGSYLAVATGLVLAVPLMLVPRLLPLMGMEFEELPIVQEYLAVRALGLPLMLLFISTRTYLQATERTQVLVFSTVCANILNLLGDLLFIYGGAELPAVFGPLRWVPAMGAKGAALATVLCSGLQWGIVLLAVRRMRDWGETRSHRPVWADIRQALQVGFPIGLHLGAEVGFFVLTGVFARTFGQESMSAHQISMVFANLTFTAALGVGNAGSVRVGWAVGQRNTPQARQSGLMAFAVGALGMALAGLVFLLFPLPLMRLMGTPPEVMPLVMPLLMVTAVFQISDGVQCVGAGVLRGAGETRFTFLANILGHYGVGLPVALLLAFGLDMGVVGLWWGLCAGLSAVALVLFLRFLHISSGTLEPLSQPGQA